MSQKQYIKPLKLGSLTLSSNIAYSPLAGCSDLPFRQMAQTYRPGIFFCEMIKMDALVRNDFNTFRLLDYTPDMHPIGAQLCGSRIQFAKKAAKMIEELGFDVVDFNCGCPVDKVTKDGSGSGMLKNPAFIGEMLNEIISAVSIPVTVKIRIGWDKENIIASHVTKIAEEAGAKAIFIHGRTREQGYIGPADWSPIKDAVAAKKKILVYGNGDIFCPISAKKIFDYTNCDGILVSRGTLGKPWLGEEIELFLNSQEQPLRNGPFLKQIFLKHFLLTKAYQREKKAVSDMRRVGCWYFKQMDETKQLREKLNKSKSMDEIEHLIHTYPWEEIPVIPDSVARETE
jgi:nifR3 family TIM-barrel protein